MHALDKLIVGRTVLMISHRLSTLGNVDEIIVLKEGRIVEQGTYKELKRRRGVFAGLLEEQNRYNVEKIGEKSIIRSAFAIPAVQVSSVPTGQQRVGSPISQPGLTMPVNPPPPTGVINEPILDNKQAMMPRQPHPHSTPLRNGRVIIELEGKIIGERPLNKPVLTVGRLSGNDVQIPNQRVSRLHAKIRYENGLWIIEDADSVNGVVYQGLRVDQHVLSDGDQIYIAPTVILHFQAAKVGSPSRA